jgi:hypothetical protein
MSCRLNKASEFFGCQDDDWCLLNVTTCQIYLKSLQILGKFTVYQGLCESHALAECCLYYSVLGHCPGLNVEAAEPLSSSVSEIVQQSDRARDYLSSNQSLYANRSTSNSPVISRKLAATQQLIARPVAEFGQADHWFTTFAVRTW